MRSSRMTRMVTAREHWVPTARGRLFARTWTPSGRPPGADATILLFHDSLGCVDVWREFPGQLAAATGRPVAAYDRLGFGRSDAHPGPLPPTFVRDEAAVVPRVCEALGLDTLVPFGHSVGGAMAVATAARFPARCVAVVTEAAQAFVEERTRAGVRAARAAFRRPDQLERVERYHGAKARWALDAWTETWLDPAFAGWSLDDDLRAVRAPLLALHGDQDEYGSVAHPARIARLAGGPSCAVILDGCGHVPHRERPEPVLDAVARFLVSHATDTATDTSTDACTDT
jgi:pimeloyl-ACP methyl ester carboxylesterase